MQPALFDSSIYIRALRHGNVSILTVRRVGSDSPLWLSSVVLEELYAGATEPARKVIERMERDFDRARRILIPNLRDWTKTGRVLARLGSKYHFERIGQGRLTNDALIATSAGRLGIRVITTNERDFRRLSEFSVFQWEVVKM